MVKKNSNIVSKISMKGVVEENCFFDCFSVDRENINLLPFDSFPKIVDGGGIGICLEGSCEVILNSKVYTLKKNDLFTVFPYTMIQLVHKSEDLRAYAIATNTDFLAGLKFSSKAVSFLFIKENPCISLSDSEISMLIKMFDDVKEKSKRKENPYRDDISVCLLTAIFYEIASIYHKVKPITNKVYSRKEQIFFKFNFLLAKYYKNHRQLDFYADELCVTTKYLSAVVKEVSGSTAGDWICNNVIINAKSLLGSTDMSVQQISDELNFPNPSFFGQYFKRSAGMTPNEYRKKISENK